MQHTSRQGVLTLVAMLAIAAWAAAPGAFSDEVGTERYDLTVVVTPERGKGAVAVYTEWRDEENHVRLSFTRTRVAAYSVSGGKQTRVGEGDAAFTDGVEGQLTLMRRGESLAVAQGDALLLQCSAPRGVGKEAGVVAEAGWSVGDARVQRVSAVAFGDDFMRAADEPGEWRTVSGKWRLRSAWEDDPHDREGLSFTRRDYAQNAFCWMGKGSPAICTTGQQFWEDYTYSFAVQPGSGDTVGALCNVRGEGDYVRWEWGPGDRKAAGGKRNGAKMRLWAVSGGKETLLAEAEGGQVPGQWYGVRITSALGSVAVAVDGREALRAAQATPWRGGVGLYVDGEGGTAFDDVAVRGRTLLGYLLEEERLTRTATMFRGDPSGHMKEFATPREWETVAEPPARFVYRTERSGNLWMVVEVLRNAEMVTGEIVMCLDGSRGSATAGLQARIELLPGGKRLGYTLLQDGKELAKGEGEVAEAGAKTTYRLWHTGDRVRLERGGEELLAAAAAPTTERWPSAQMTGAFANVQRMQVLGADMHDYTFSGAPTDWRMEGTWQQSTRWACDPKWSFLAGWGRGRPALWYSYSVDGNQSCEAYLGLKMEYPREPADYEFRYRDFAVSICTDGEDPLSGYALVYVATETSEAGNGKTVLMRRGKVVAERMLDAPNKGNAHRAWFHLELRKKGAHIQAWARGVPVLAYDDPEPLVGGIPVIWTANNGIMVARARIYSDNAPMPELRSEIVVPRPWYPEWVNIGTPFTLDFSGTWAQSGHSVQMSVTPKLEPLGEKAQPFFLGDRLVFSPTTIGEHWYEVVGSDGTGRSRGFDFAVQVRDPRKGRDDGSALALYRFDEGKGRIVRDLSGRGDAADLAIPEGAPVEWAPGRGLRLRGSALVATEGPVAKLLGPAKKRAMTLEAWLSCDTLYPPTADWRGVMLSNGTTGAGAQNFALGQQQHGLVFAQRGTDVAAWNGVAPCVSYGAQMKLSHVAVTWDGKKTTMYVDGVQKTTAEIAWDEGAWTAQRLMLGNNEEGARGFQGTFYLVAIHDKCFSQEEVTRHWEAGPAG